MAEREYGLNDKIARFVAKNKFKERTIRRIIESGDIEQLVPFSFDAQGREQFIKFKSEVFEELERQGKLDAWAAAMKPRLSGDEQMAKTIWANMDLASKITNREFRGSVNPYRVDMAALAANFEFADSYGKELYTGIRSEINAIKFYRARMRDLYTEAQMIAKGIRAIQEDSSLTREEKIARILDEYGDRFNQVIREVAALQEKAHQPRWVAVPGPDGKPVRMPIKNAIAGFLETWGDLLPDDTTDLLRKELKNYYGDDRMIYNAVERMPGYAFDIQKPGGLAGFIYGEFSKVKEDARLSQLERIIDRLDVLSTGGKGWLSAEHRLLYQEPGMEDLSKRLYVLKDAYYTDWKPLVEEDPSIRERFGPAKHMIPEAILPVDQSGQVNLDYYKRTVADGLYERGFLWVDPLTKANISGPPDADEGKYRLPRYFKDQFTDRVEKGIYKPGEWYYLKDSHEYWQFVGGKTSPTRNVDLVFNVYKYHQGQMEKIRTQYFADFEQVDAWIKGGNVLVGIDTYGWATKTEIPGEVFAELQSYHRFDNWQKEAEAELKQYLKGFTEGSTFGSDVGWKHQSTIAQQQIEQMAKELGEEVPEIPSTRQQYLQKGIITPEQLEENMEFDRRLAEMIAKYRSTGVKFGREPSPLENWRMAVTEKLLTEEVRSGVKVYTPAEGLPADIRQENLVAWSRYIEDTPEGQVGKGRFLHRFAGDKLAYRLTKVTGTLGSFEADAIDPTKTWVKFDIDPTFDMVNWARRFNEEHLAKVVPDYDPFIDNLLRSNWSYIAPGKYADSNNLISQVLSEYGIADYEGNLYKVAGEAERLLRGRLGFTYGKDPELYMDAMQDLVVALMMAHETSHGVEVSSEEVLRNYYRLQNEGLKSAYTSGTVSVIDPEERLEDPYIRRARHTGRMAVIEVIKQMQLAGEEVTNYKDAAARVIAVRDYITANAGKPDAVHWGKMGYFNALKTLSKKEIEAIARETMEGREANLEDGAFRGKDQTPLSIEELIETEEEGILREESLLQSMEEQYERQTGRKYSRVRRMEDIEEIFKILRSPVTGKDALQPESDEELRRRIVARNKGKQLNEEQLARLVEQERQSIIKRRQQLLTGLTITPEGIPAAEQQMLAMEYMALLKQKQPTMNYIDLLDEVGRVAGTHHLPVIFDEVQFIEALMDEQGRDRLSRTMQGNYTFLQSLALMNRQEGFNFTVFDEQGRRFTPVVGSDGQLLAEYEDHSRLISKTGKGEVRVEDLSGLKPTAFVRHSLGETAGSLVDEGMAGYVKGMGSQYDALVRMRDSTWLQHDPTVTLRNLEAMLAGRSGLVFDIETTSLLDDPDFQILEIASMDVDLKEGQAVYGEPESILVRPTQSTYRRIQSIIDDIAWTRTLPDGRTANVWRQFHVGQHIDEVNRINAAIENEALGSTQRARLVEELQARQAVGHVNDIMFMRNIAKFTDPEWGRKDIQNLGAEYTMDKLAIDVNRALRRLETEGVDLDEAIAHLVQKSEGKVLVGHNIASFDIPGINRLASNLYDDVLQEEIRRTTELMKNTNDSYQVVRYYERLQTLTQLAELERQGKSDQARRDKINEAINRNMKMVAFETNRSPEYIPLAEPQLNPWYTSGNINRIQELLGLTDAQYRKLLETEGVEGIRRALSTIDYTSLSADLESTLADPGASSYARRRASRRLKVVRGLAEAGVAPTDMVLDIVPVKQEAKLERHYRNLALANKQLSRAISLGDEEAIIRNRNTVQQILSNITGAPPEIRNNRWVTSFPGAPEGWDIGTENSIIRAHQQRTDLLFGENAYLEDLSARLDRAREISQGIDRPIVDTLPLFRWVKPGEGHSIEKMAEFYKDRMAAEGYIGGTHHLGIDDVRTEAFGLAQMAKDYMDRPKQPNHLQQWQQGDIFAVVSQEGASHIPLGEYEFVRQEGANVVVKDLDTGKAMTFWFDNPAQGERFFIQNVKELDTPGEFNEQLLMDDVNRAVQKGILRGSAGLDYLQFVSDPDKKERWGRAYERINQIQGDLDELNRYVDESVINLTGEESDELRRLAGEARREYIRSLPLADQALLLNRAKFSEFQKEVLDQEELTPRQQRRAAALSEILESDLFQKVVRPRMQQIEDMASSGKITRNDAEDLIRAINNAIKENAPRTTVSYLHDLGDIFYDQKNVGRLHVDLSTEATVMRSLYSQAEILGAELFPGLAENEQRREAINRVLMPHLRSTIAPQAERFEDVASIIMRQKDIKMQLGQWGNAEVVDWRIPIHSGTEVYTEIQTKVNKVFGEQLQLIRKRQIDQGYEIHEGHDLAESVIQRTRAATQAEYGVLPNMFYNIGTRSQDVDTVLHRIGRPIKGVEGLTLEEIYDNFLAHQRQVEFYNKELIDLARQMDEAREKNLRGYTINRLKARQRRVFELAKEEVTARQPYLNALGIIADPDADLDSVSDLTLRAREMLGQTRIWQPTGEERLTKWDYKAAPSGRPGTINYAGYRIQDIPDEALLDYLNYQTAGVPGAERTMVWNYLQQKGYQAVDAVTGETLPHLDWRRSLPEGTSINILPPVNPADSIVQDINESIRQGNEPRIDSPDDLIRAVNEQAKQTPPKAPDDKGFFRTLIEEAGQNRRLKMLLGIAGGLAVAGFSLRQLTNNDPLEPQDYEDYTAEPTVPERVPIEQSTYVGDNGGARLRIKTKAGNIPHDQIGNIISETVNSEIPDVNINVNLVDNSSRLTNDQVQDMFAQYLNHGYVVNRGG